MSVVNKEAKERKDKTNVMEAELKVKRGKKQKK